MVSTKANPPHVTRHRRFALAVAVVTLAAAMGVVIWSADRSGAGPAGNAAAAPASPDITVLAGDWHRTDGDYVLRLRVDGSGKPQAEYFNPRPIKVFETRATRDGNALRVFVELRDVGYPGSRYDLVFDPANDCLVGDYFQAMENRSYRVVLARMKAR